MGSYHSYVGDMKLEDSKDNWYRISGLNTTGAYMFGFKYNENVAGEHYEIRNSTTQVTLFKLTQSFTNIYSVDPVTENIDSCGRGFVIKDRQLEFQTIFPDDSKDKKLYGKAYYISNHSPLYIGIYGIRTLASPRGIRLETVQPDENTYFRPMLTLKPIGDPEGTVLYCEITAKLITQPYGYDRTIKFKPLYSKYTITKVELVLNIDENGNYNTKGSTGTFGVDVMAGIVPPKNDETICIEFRTTNQKASGNAYTLKITFNNSKVLYLQDALITTGMGATDKTDVRYDIYRENRLK